MRHQCLTSKVLHRTVIWLSVVAAYPCHSGTVGEMERNIHVAEAMRDHSTGMDG